MIIRTYQRRNRAGSVNDGSSQESFWSSSQESAWSSSQEAALSSQELSTWPEEEDEEKLTKSLQKMSSLEPIPKRRKQEETFLRAASADFSKEARKPTKEAKILSKELNSLQRNVGLSLNKRWGFSAPPNSTLMEAQESGEMVEQIDEVNFAMDGIREGQPLQIQQASLVSMLSLCTSLQQRRFLRSHGIAKTLLDAVVGLPTSNLPLALAAASVLYLLASDGRDANILDSESCIGFLLKLIGCESEDNRGTDTVAKVVAVFEKLRTGKNINDVIAADQLTPKFLALRTLEKACLSAVVLDDNSGTVTKLGGQFKERLRELRGLDVICDLATSCLVNLVSKVSKSVEADVSMLLRCLRVMENVTFLSEENQGYLLRLKHDKTPSTFIEMVIKTIVTLQKILSEDNWNKPTNKGEGRKIDVASLKASSTEPKIISPRPSAFSGSGNNSNRKELKLRNALQNAKILNSQRKVSLTRNCQKMVQVKVSDKDRRFKDPNDVFPKNSGLKSLEENGGSDDPFAFSQDPYYFNEVDVDYKSQKRSQPKRSGLKKTSSVKSDEASEATSVSIGKETGKLDSSLLEDCLLSAVKVLMNLTNDNASGCKQVAACNGIDSIASLLVSNYPSSSQTEASLDLLVTTLGMLVNLVEKDCDNRSQLASLDVTIPADISSKDKNASGQGRGMISLLCSLFLSKKGSGEAAEAREGFIAETEVEEDSLKKGQREAENMIVEAYTALVLAFLSTESEEARQAIADRLPAEGLQSLVPVLERFVAFHLSLNMISAETHAAVTNVINSLKKPTTVQIDE